MSDSLLTRAEGFPCQGHLLSGEPVEGLLTLRYSRQMVDGFPEPVGAGMTRWCQLDITGTIPPRPTVFTAVVASQRLGERVQIEVTPEIISTGDGGWQCQGPYELKHRWKLTAEESKQTGEGGTTA